jgi:predicted CoA-binding protein
MNSRTQIDEFLAQKTLAFVGVSRSPHQFANSAFRELRKAGYRLFPVHPEMETFEGVPCHRRLTDVPEPVGGAVVMVAPARAEEVVRDAAAAHVPRIWFQQQGSNEAALRACENLGIPAVHDQCIMMFMPGTGFGHRLHRGIVKLFGKLPK